MQVYPEKTPALVTELVNAESISAFLAKIHEEEEKITALGALTQTPQTSRLPHEVFKGFLQSKQLKLDHYYQHLTPSEDECNILAESIRYRNVAKRNLVNLLIKAPLALKGKIEIGYLFDALKLIPLHTFQDLVKGWDLTLKDAYNLYNNLTTKTYARKRRFVLETQPQLPELLRFITTGQTTLLLNEVMFLFNQETVLSNPFYRTFFVNELNSSVNTKINHLASLNGVLAESFAELYFKHGLSLAALLQYTYWPTIKLTLDALLQDKQARSAVIAIYTEEIIDLDAGNISWLHEEKQHKYVPYLLASEIKIPVTPRDKDKLSYNLLSVYGKESLLVPWLLELKPQFVDRKFCLHPALSPELRLTTITKNLDMLTEPNILNRLRQIDPTTYKNLHAHVRDKCSSIANYTLIRLVEIGMHIPFKVLLQNVSLRTVDRLAPIIYKRYEKSLSTKPRFHKYFVFFLASKRLDVSADLPPDWKEAVKYLKSSPFSSFK